MILPVSSSTPKVFLTFHFPSRHDRHNIGNFLLQTCTFSCSATFPLHTVRDMWHGGKMNPIPLGTEGDAIPSSLVSHRHLSQLHSLCSPASLFTAWWVTSSRPLQWKATSCNLHLLAFQIVYFFLVYLSRYRLTCRGFFFVVVVLVRLSQANLWFFTHIYILIKESSTWARIFSTVNLITVSGFVLF